MRLKLGESWKCACGRKIKLDGVWLAAHWDLALRRVCKCGVAWSIKAGKVEKER